MTLGPATQLERLRIAVEKGIIDDVELVAPSERDVIAGGIRLHFLDWPAQVGARPVVMLHGGHLTAHTWDLVCLQLRPAYQCIALDQRGHGDSEWALDLDYSTDAFVRDLEEFASVVGLADYVLVGMSLGGLNAIEFAARHGSQLRGLVLVDVGPELHTEGTRKIGAFAQATSEAGSIDEFVEGAVAFNPLRDPELLRTGVMHGTRVLYNGTRAWKYDDRFGRLVSHDYSYLATRLAAITCPTLVVRGAESRVFWDEDAQRVVDRLPIARWLQIPHAGHTVQGDNPRLLAAALREFFAEIGA